MFMYPTTSEQYNSRLPLVMLLYIILQFRTLPHVFLHYSLNVLYGQLIFLYLTIILLYLKLLKVFHPKGYFRVIISVASILSCISALGGLLSYQSSDYSLVIGKLASSPVEGIIWCVVMRTLWPPRHIV